MKEARFQYKCRRCGESSENSCCDASPAWLYMMECMHGWKSTSGGISLTMLQTHDCKDGGKGVADLIGYTIKEN